MVLDFESSEDVLELDPDMLDAQMSVADFIAAHAHATQDGIELRLDSGDTILLEGYTDIGALETAIVFI